MCRMAETHRRKVQKEPWLFFLEWVSLTVFPKKGCRYARSQMRSGLESTLSWRIETIWRYWKCRCARSQMCPGLESVHSRGPNVQKRTLEKSHWQCFQRNVVAVQDRGQMCSLESALSQPWVPMCKNAHWRKVTDSVSKERLSLCKKSDALWFIISSFLKELKLFEGIQSVAVHKVRCALV